MSHPNDPPSWPDRFGDADTYCDEEYTLGDEDEQEGEDGWPSREDLAYDEVYG